MEEGVGQRQAGGIIDGGVPRGGASAGERARRPELDSEPHAAASLARREGVVMTIDERSLGGIQISESRSYLRTQDT
jgi:hypothetical protein